MLSAVRLALSQEMCSSGSRLHNTTVVIKLMDGFQETLDGVGLPNSINQPEVNKERLTVLLPVFYKEAMPLYQ